jgi:O-antigen/teichoic acid export membrane protein
VLNIPVALVAANLSRVYLGEAPKQKENGNLWRFTWGIWKTLIALAIVPSILAIFVLADVLNLLLGPKWVEASNIILIFLPSVLLQFCVVPISACLAIKGLQYRSLRLQMFGLITQVGGIYAAYYIGIIETIEGFAIGALIYYLVYTATVLWSAKDEA